MRQSVQLALGYRTIILRDSHQAVSFVLQIPFPGRSIWPLRQKTRRSGMYQLADTQACTGFMELRKPVSVHTCMAFAKCIMDSAVLKFYNSIMLQYVTVLSLCAHAHLWPI